MTFVANFIRFQRCKNFENPVEFDKVTENLKVRQSARVISTPSCGCMPQ